MLHASVLKAGNQGKIEFLKGVVNGGVLFQPAQCDAMQVKNRIKIARDLFPVALSVQHRHLTAVYLSSLALKFSGDKGEQVGADQLRGRKAQALSFPQRFKLLQRRIGNGLPIGGHRQRQRVTCLQVGLIKKRKGCSSPVRDKKRIEKLRIAIERAVSGRELHAYSVLARAYLSCRNDKMLRFKPIIRRLTVDFDGAEFSCRFLKIEHQRLVGF